MPGTRTPALTTRQQACVAQLLGRCERVGPPLHQSAEAALAERGVRAIRLIQGVLDLTRKYPREAMLRAATTALTHRLFRYKASGAARDPRRTGAAKAKARRGRATPGAFTSASTERELTAAGAARDRQAFGR